MMVRHTSRARFAPSGLVGYGRNMAWASGTRTTMLACCWVGAAFVACSGTSFQQGSGSAGAAGSSGTAAGATAGTSSEPSGGTKSGGGNGSAGTVSSGGSGGSAALGGRGGSESAGTGTVASGGEAAGGAPDAPAPISMDGLVFWFKADAGVTEENGTVSSWADQSSNGYDATQSEVDERPKLTKSSDLPLKVLELDGVDDHLHLPAFEPELGAGISFFAVAGRSQDSTCSGIVELSNGAEIDDISFDSLGSSFQFEVVNSTIYANADEFPQGKLRLIEAFQSADPLQPVGELRANGLSVGSGAMNAPLPLLRTDNQIGDSLYGDCSPFPGAIGEIILYGRKLGTEERVAVENYLKTKWQCCN